MTLGSSEPSVHCVRSSVRRGKKDQISGSMPLSMHCCTYFVVMKKKVELFDNIMFGQSRTIREALQSSQTVPLITDVKDNLKTVQKNFPANLGNTIQF